jgi:hypothetical protein
MAPDDVGERQPVGEPQDLGLLDRPLDTSSGDDGRQVEQRSRTVVTGMPLTNVISSGATRAWWIWMIERARRQFGTVTSTRPRALGSMPHNAAADR